MSKKGSRWYSKAQVREIRRAGAEVMKKERERRLDDLADWLSEQGSRAHGEAIKLALRPGAARRPR